MEGASLQSAMQMQRPDFAESASDNESSKIVGVPGGEYGDCEEDLYQRTWKPHPLTDWLFKRRKKST